MLLAAQLVILGLVVASNNLAVAMALGALGQAMRRWRIIIMFGLFEFFMPLLGLATGRRAALVVEDNLGWLAPLLLAILGAVTVFTAMRDDGDDLKLVRRMTTWTGLVLLAGTLSIDNVIVGFSLGLLDAPALVVAGTIGVFSVCFTWLGLRIGRSSRRHWERAARLASGALLLILAIVVIAT